MTSNSTPQQPETEKPTKRMRHAISTSGTPVEHAIALREALVTAARQTNELIRSLKQQKRQTRLVESTLASLKQLQKAAG
ncbi:MAG TPA: hypothetical protein VG713_00265 [Pirellulales bacterium]|nr:hypothetical protein [Pirellulales bacterium]